MSQADGRAVRMHTGHTQNRQWTGPSSLARLSTRGEGAAPHAGTVDHAMEDDTALFSRVADVRQQTGSWSFARWGLQRELSRTMV